jgi:hypothetical protein
MSNFTNIELLNKAHAAAKAAVLEQKPLEATDWFPCGFAWVTIKGTTQFAKYCAQMNKETGGDAWYGDKGYPKGWTFWCPSSGHTQRMKTHEAAAKAFAKVLTDNGVEAVAGCRMD